MDPTSIHTLGASAVGSAAGHLLAERGVPVRVPVRHPKKAAALAEAGVEVFPGDPDSPESIDQAMRGVSSAIVVTPPVVPQELSVIDSAERAGVEHLVKITTMASADSPIARRRNQNEIEDAWLPRDSPTPFCATTPTCRTF